MKNIRVLLLALTCCIAYGVLYYIEHAEVYSSVHRSEVIIGNEHSPMLSKFHGTEVSQQYSIILPSKGVEDREEYPTIFHIPGFGGNHFEVYKYVDRIRSIEETYPDLNFIHVFLNPEIASDHHGFVDSQINGPREKAFTLELLPILQQKYRVSKNPNKLFLTGHSSGGWSVIWLLLRNPSRFAGAWATSPDPLDFKYFYGVNFNLDSKENVYRHNDGTSRIYFTADRDNQNAYTKGFSVMKEEIESDERRFATSKDKTQSEVYDRETGDLIQAVLEKWRHYDLHYLISKDPDSYLAGLKKIKIIVGTKDNYFLDKPTRSFCSLVSSFKIQEACRFIEGRNHIDLYASHPSYPNFLDIQLYKEMQVMLDREN